MEEDIYSRYFRYHYKLHGTINNIGDNDIVEYEGQTLKIGWFKRTIRNKHSYYIQGLNKRGCCTPLMLKRYKVLDELEFEWTPQKKITENKLENDIFIRYLQEHYKEHGTINDIGYNDIVEFSGQTIKIGVFVKTMRRKHHLYIDEQAEKRNPNKVLFARFKALEEMNFCWNIRKEYHDNLLEFDPFIAFLQEYYTENGTINNISNRAIVEYNGEELNIGQFLKNIRHFHNNFDPNKREYGEDTLKLYFKRKEILEMMNFEWTPFQKTAAEKANFDPFIEYLKLYYQQHGTINDIPFSTEDEFNGQILKIGEFLKSIRYNHKFYISGEKRVGCATKIAIRRYQALDELGFIWNPDKQKEYTSTARAKGLKPSTVSHLVRKFNGDVDKALSISIMRKQSREETKVKRKEQNNLENLVSSFDVNKDSLESYSTKTRAKTPQKQRDTLMYDDKTTLAEFCLQKGYNYDVILRAIKRYRQENPTENLDVIIDECISQYNSKEQGPVYNWIYGKYDNEILAKHLLISLGLDYHAVLRDMTSNSITLEEAIERECFRKSAKKEHSYLDGIFYEFMDFYQLTDSQEELDSYTKKMISKYHLSSEELEIINTAFNKYVATIRQYQLCDVGFEKDQDAKVQKAIEYHLTPSEIEEAVFMPLRFDRKVLLGQESELAKRRTTLKELTLAWNSYTDEDQIAAIEAHNLTSDEIWYITTTRQNIDTVQEKVLKISK